MSVLVVAVGTDGVITASDGICYEYETGNVAGFVSKVILVPEFSMVIGCTGAGAFMTTFRQAMEQEVSSFDDLVEIFEGLCEYVHRGLFTDGYGYDTGPRTEMSCVIAGWSDKRRAYEGYRAVSYAKESVDQGNGRSITLEPFKATPLPSGLWCSYQPKHMEEFGLSGELKDSDQTIDIASRFVCAARADSGPTKGVGENEGDDRHFNAGGFLQLTVLQKDYTQSWIAHRWEEDQIGRPIDPTGPDRFPAWLKERYEHALAETE